MFEDILGTKKDNKIIIYCPYIPLQVTKTVIKSKPRKLKCNWFFEGNLIVNENEVLKEMNEC